MHVEEGISIPAFAYPAIEKHRCRECETNDWSIYGAGVKHRDEGVCFFVTLRCQSCNYFSDLIFADHKVFWGGDWALEVAGWIGDSARPDRVHTILLNMPVIPGVTVLVRQQNRMIRLQLCGGYGGEVGPLLLLYKRLNPPHPRSAYGVVRIEPNDRLLFLKCSDSDALAITRWVWFRDLPDGKTFEHKKAIWTKLSTQRVMEIVRDRVFVQFRAGDRMARVPGRPKRRSRG